MSRLLLVALCTLVSGCAGSPTDALPIVLSFNTQRDSVTVANTSARRFAVELYSVDPAVLPYSSMAVCAGAPLGPGERIVFAIPKVSHPVSIVYCDLPVPADVSKASIHQIPIQSGS